MSPVLVAERDLCIVQGELLAALADGTVQPGDVDAIVTSPPYLDVRPEVSSRVTVRDYAAWASDWLCALRNRLYPAGSLMLNLGRVHRDGRELRWHEPVLQAAEAAGFLHIDTIVWHKVNGGGGRRTPYLLDRHEHVYWLALRTDPYKGFEDARQPYSPATLERYERSWSPHGGSVKGKDSAASEGRVAHPGGALPGSVFTSSVGADKGNPHPTPMPIELAEFLVRLACVPGGIVLDPFAGSGTTGIAALRLGRSAVLVELETDWASYAARRIHAEREAGRIGQHPLPFTG